MDSLPVELVAKITSVIPDIPDLISLRLVSKRYAAIASRPLFEMLRLSGSRQDQPPIMAAPDPMVEYSLPSGRVGRTKTVEFSKLPEAVDELLACQFMPYIKTLVFDPAYYRETFWQHYREYIEELMDEPVDEADIDWDEEDEIDAELYDNGEEMTMNCDAAMERAFERRQTRPQREAPIIDAAEAIWIKEFVTQKENEEAVIAALCKLFESMTSLNNIQIMPWLFDGSILFPGLQWFQYEVLLPPTFPLRLLSEPLIVS